MSSNELKLSNSFLLRERGLQSIAGFTQSMMKKPEQFALGRFPVYLESGEGACVKDVDGNQYVDFICGLGATTLGHNHPLVNGAITDALGKGLIHSLPTEIEVTAAESLRAVIPGAERIRFFKAGADANSAAIRLARFVTGREKLITVGYNGWHDHFMYDTPGIPKAVSQLTTRLPLFSPTDEAPALAKIEEQGREVAAVILSVPYTRELSREFLLEVKHLCGKVGCLFILDEIVSGFRLAVGGVQEYFGITADIVTVSKGIAAGMPLSAVCGRASLLDEMEKLQVSTTFGGEMLSLAVCKSVLEFYRESNYISHVRELGAQLKLGVNQVASRLDVPLEVVGYDAIPMFLFDRNPAVHAKMAEEYVAQMAKRGFLLRRDVNFINHAHTVDQINQAIVATEASLAEMIELNQFNQHQVETV